MEIKARSNKFISLWIIGTFAVIIVLFFCLLGKVLSNTMEIASHNLKGASGNTVYISPDGHKEAVYNRNGDLVTDSVNMGSYNFYYYKEHPYKHFTLDILPWIFWGNAEDDTSTVIERIVAFGEDFQSGIRSTFKIK